MKNSYTDKQTQTGYQPGLSLLLAVILVALLVAVSAGLATLVVDSIRQSADMAQSTQAYYIAEGTLQQALMTNAQLEHQNKGVGADVTVSCDPAQDPNCTAKYNYTIKGALTGLDKLNGEYIVPFPWSGNAPWHGEGAKPEGGCDANKPPTTTSNGAYFSYAAPGQSALDYNVLNHPCNWNMIKVGEKASIPLYTVQTDGSGNQTYTNITNFLLRLRTPCFDGSEFCAAQQRWVLNCFDKGTGEELCTASDFQSDLYKKGEVVMTWQIDATDNNTSQLISFLPSKHTATATPYKYYPDDSQFYEGKINSDIASSTDNNSAYKEILTETWNAVKTGDLSSVTIANILSNNNFQKPTLKISLISDLIGCSQNSCDSTKTSSQPKIPYLEYQVDFGSTVPTGDLPGPDNVITASGTSGAFTRTIQVKVPHESSNLEYVIQQ